MKHRHMIALAGAAAMFAAVPVQGVPTISAVVNFTDPFLVANNLVSATISITGFTPGTGVQGFLGTAPNPWNVWTGDGSGFFNIDSVVDPGSPSTPLFTDGYYAAPSNNAAINAINPAARWDSGLLGSLNAQPDSSLGHPSDSDPSDDVGGFGMFSAGGSNDINIDPTAWITLAQGGIPVGPSSNLRVMRLTWKANTAAHVSFVLAMSAIGGGQDTPMSITLPVIPGPGGLAPLALGGALMLRQRRRLTLVEDQNSAQGVGD